MTGCKPVVEIMCFDFIGVAFDQILNQAAKIHFMTGGRAPASLVIRTQFGPDGRPQLNTRRAWKPYSHIAPV